MNRTILSFESVCKTSDYVYAVPTATHGVFRVDINDGSGEMELIATLDNHKLKGTGIRSAEKCGDCIYFIPFTLKERPIVVFSESDNTVRYINTDELGNSQLGEYRPIIRVGDDLWMFPTDIKRELIIFHMNTESMENVSEWRKALRCIKYCVDNNWQKVGNVNRIGDKLYHSLIYTSYIVSIDIKTKEVQVHELEGIDEFSAASDCHDDSIWFSLNRNCGLVQWSPDKGIENLIKEPFKALSIDEMKEYYSWFSILICGKEALWLVPVKDDRLIRISYQSKELEMVQLFPGVMNKSDTNFLCLEKQDGIAEVYQCRTNLSFKIDLDKDTILQDYVQYNLDNKWNNKFRIEYESINGIIYESDKMSVRDFTKCCENIQ